MNKKKTEHKKISMPNAEIEGGGVVVEQKITNTLEQNYMPYAMSVIVSRALPEIDGFKPSHRKLLYTMYKMGLLTSQKTKSANIVGQTMRLNPHGDQAIYETMVRLTRGNEALLHPYIDSKGNFGKAYSRDMAYAASRYTEAKLADICNELFRDIDKNTVDFVPNYDNTMQEPTLFPTTFPSVLVNSNVGIAVSMASNVCSFNLSEVCETTIALIKNPEHDIISTLKGPDFSGGGYMLYNEEDLSKVYKTGHGSIKIRSRYNYDKEANCLEITEIPPTTTVEAIIDKVIELIKLGKIKEISYLRDETDLQGLKLAIDLKRGIDPDKLMQKLYRLTPLQDNYPCNFNILISGTPKVMGVGEIITEWTAFRKECIKRRVFFDLQKKKEKLHLLKGLKEILLDIDKAIKIVRETDEEVEVVPNLMIGFGLDEIQANYVAEIKLRHLNREYILNRISEIEQLLTDITEMESILADDKKVKNIIIKELKDVSLKYGQSRKTKFIYSVDEENIDIEEDIPDYTVNLFLSSSGYFKKITQQSLRMSNEQKLKDGDTIVQNFETTNKTDILFFSDKGQVYKAKVSQFEDTKASLLGEYIPAKLGFDDGENVFFMVITRDYSGYILFIFENGKVARIPINAYETKSNRKKLANAYATKSKLVKIITEENESEDIIIKSTNGRVILFNTAMILPKDSRNSIGVQVMTLKANSKVFTAFKLTDTDDDFIKKYRIKNIPAVGYFAKELEDPNQLTI